MDVYGLIRKQIKQSCDRGEPSSDVMKCRTCGGPVTVIARQTRAIDEPMTVFYLCQSGGCRTRKY